MDDYGYSTAPSKTSNVVETRQRAYRPLDVCNQDGFWVEETAFNRKGSGAKTLCGNWQEQRALADEPPAAQSLQRIFQSSETVSLPKPKSSAKFALGPGGTMVPVFDDADAPPQRLSLITAQSTTNLIGDSTAKLEARSAYQDEIGTVRVGATQQLKRRPREEMLERQLLEQASQTVKTKKEELARVEVDAPVKKSAPSYPGGDFPNHEALHRNPAVTIYTQRSQKPTFGKDATFSTPIELYQKGYTKE